MSVTGKEQSDRTTTLVELKRQVQEFIAERDWGKYHTPNNLAVSIGIEAAELMELFQWISDKEIDGLLNNTDIMQRLRNELADVIIYCLSLANVTETDISQAVAYKLDENKHKYPTQLVKGVHPKYKELGDSRRE